MKKDEHARKRKELTKRKVQEEKTAALNRLVCYVPPPKRLNDLLTSSSSNPKFPRQEAQLQSQRLSLRPLRQLGHLTKRKKLRREPTRSTPDGSARGMASSLEFQRSG